MWKGSYGHAAEKLQLLLLKPAHFEEVYYKKSRLENCRSKKLLSVLGQLDRTAVIFCRVTHTVSTSRFVIPIKSCYYFDNVLTKIER